MLHHAADIGVELPELALLREILHQQMDRQAALHFELAEQAGLGLFQHRLRQIGGDDLDPPAGEQRGHFLQQHRDRIGLLPGRRRRAPDPQGTARGARLRQRRQHRILQMIERDLVAKEEGLVGGHGFDHFRSQRFGAALHPLHELGNAVEIRPARQRQQAALDQILLVGREIEAGTLLQQLTQILVVQRRHERSPANTRTSFAAI